MSRLPFRGLRQASLMMLIETRDLATRHIPFYGVTDEEIVDLFENYTLWNSNTILLPGKLMELTKRKITVFY